MKILIVGSNGQLGSELAACLDRGHTELGKLPQELRSAEVVKADIDTLDIANKSAVKDFVRSGFDVIVNCAAYTNVNSCETELDSAFKTNALGIAHLASAAEMINAKLVHISTDYVFDGNSVVPYREYDTCNPQSVYGKTKYLGEQYVKALCSRFFIIRTAWLYGYSGANFVHTIKQLGMTQKTIKVVADQRGNPTNAADLAHHILLLLLTEEYGIYHCTGEGECSWYEFAKKIIQLYGLNCKVEPCTTQEYPTPAKRPKYSSLDNMMLRCTVGNFMRNWDEALESFITKEKEGLIK